MPTPRVAALVLIAAGSFVTAAPAHATYPGTNGEIVYVKTPYAKGGKPVLRAVTPAGAPVPSFAPTATYAYQPTFSADGQHLAYSTFTTTKDPTFFLWTSDANGATPKQINQSTDLDSATWAPDGLTLAFGSYYSGLQSVDRDGVTVPRELLPAARGYDTVSPAYTPDGSRLVYQRSRLTKQGNETLQSIWVVLANGTGARKLAGGTRKMRYATSPDVSPDGMQAAFIGVTRGQGNRPKTSLYVIGLDGSGLRRVAGTPSANTYFAGVVWSPDGTKLLTDLYGTTTKFAEKLQVIDAISGVPTTIHTGHRTGFSDATWQPLPIAPQHR